MNADLNSNSIEIKTTISYNLSSSRKLFLIIILCQSPFNRVRRCKTPLWRLFCRPPWRLF